MARLSLAVASGLLALLPSVLADTCSDVSGSTKIKVEKPISISYETAQFDYWSTGCGALRPSCILTPTTAQDVADIVTLLRSNNETFAIKSGGHNPNNYWSSIDGGPLISTKEMNEVTLDTQTETVRVGPGNRWEDVHKKLDGTGYTVVGGRIGNVGVGGYILGGGLSFMSTEHGWAANNVEAIDLVLANGTMTTASNTSNPELFAALKGGGNNFGIVTSYLLKVHPQGDIWGGNYVFNATAGTTKALLAALRDFTEYYPDEKAGIILTTEQTLFGAVNLWIMFLYYNGPTPPAGVFDNFTNIGPEINSCKTRSMADLLTTNNWSVVKGQVWSIGTETTPLPSAQAGPEVLQSYYDHWKNNSKPILNLAGGIASMAFQPIPKSLARLAKSKGGDMLGLDDSVDRIIMEFDYSFLLTSHQDKGDAAMQSLYGGMRDRVLDFQKQGKLPADVYTPIFMNDMYHRQDYWGRIKPESAQLAKKVMADVDPEGFFSKRTNGPKMSA